jgi:SPFH domain / Band 7 family
MSKSSSNQSHHPLSLRLLLKYGSWFGAGFVPDMTVQVIYRDGLYAGVRGPGRFRYNRFTETLGPQISVGAQRRPFNFADMLSQDGLPIMVRLSILFSYDPRRGPQFARAFARTTPEIRLNLVTSFAERSTRVAISRRNSIELPQAQSLESAEEEISRALQTDMGPLGFEFPSNRPVMILQIQPPATLTNRHEQNAQRRAQIMAGEEFNTTDYRRALIAEFIENLAKTGAGESIINLNELVESYVADVGPRVINQPPAPSQASGSPPPPPPPPPPKSDRPRSRLS